MTKNLQDPEAKVNKNKHPREAIRRQQEIREDIRLVGQDINELKTSYENEMRKKKVQILCCIVICLY